jgi:ribosomal 30S subunit maturation factor RimM
MPLRLQDLLSVGKATPDENGWLRFHPDRGVSNEIPVDVFLFFAQHKVWYVTIVETQIRQGRTFLRFSEPEVWSAVRDVGRVSIMIAPDDTPGEDGPLPDLEGRELWFEDKLVGTVADWFHNNAQWVLVCNDPDGVEFMIPYVEAFIAGVQSGRILLRDAADLLPSCESTF